MKNSILILLLATSNLILAQNSNGLSDKDRLAISVYLPDQVEGIPAIAQNNITNKLNSLVVNNGMGNADFNNRFILTANVSVLTKDITPTAPPMHAYTLELTLFIGDGIEGNLFATTSTTLKGVGKNENKAYLAALKNFNIRGPQYQGFFDKGKQKILEFYEAECNRIITEAEGLAAQKKFEESLFTLSTIPNVVLECYYKGIDKSVEVFKQKLEYECQQNISNANSLIAQDKWDEAAQLLGMYTPDMDCYAEVSELLKKITNHICAIQLGNAKAAWGARNTASAAEFLGAIPTDSDCAEEAMAMANEIAGRLDAQEKREWDLAYEKYNRDQVMAEQRLEAELNLAERNQVMAEKSLDSQLSINERNQTMSEKSLDSQLSIDERSQTMREKQQVMDDKLLNREMDYKENQGYDVQLKQIAASRDVGVAYGKNQPKNVTYNIAGWY